MRFRCFVVLCVVCALIVLIFPLEGVQAQNYIQYTVKVNGDGSAAWTITQVSESNGTVDTWTGFQQRVASLIEAAANQTQREMSLNPNSPQISTTISSNASKITEYMFTWVNFSAVQDGNLTFGDVFSVSGFFNQLYGDGALQIAYPSTYTLKSVSPAPDERIDSTQTLQWLGTQFFVGGNPHFDISSFSLPTSSPAPDPTANGSGWQLPLFVAVGSAAVAAALAAGFLTLKRRRRKAINLSGTLADAPVIESEEQKIVKIIRSSGGRISQSAITEQCRFSKAKTSQLLSALEKKGVVRRYKKGRDKIVTLADQGKSE